MYGTPHPQQLLIFITALGVGFLLGILYDFLRAVRLSLTKSKKANVFFDILYFMLFALFSYLYIIASNKGDVRLYILAGELIGCAFYYFSLGIAVIRLTDIFVAFLRKAYSLIFKIITAPFLLAIRFFHTLTDKICQKFKKTQKKSSKIQKRVLQNTHLYVYNLFGIICANSSKTKKGGMDNGKKEKNKNFH